MMSWKKDRASQRIDKFITEVPAGAIAVQRFSEYRDDRLVKAQAGQMVREQAGQIEIPRDRAIETHGVHVYANLMDFNSVLEDVGVETEASHRRALEFRACAT